MISYGIIILPLILKLRNTHLQVTNPWYADDTGARGNFAALRAHLEYLMVRTPPWDYFPELTKRILVISEMNSPRAEA